MTEDGKLAVLNAAIAEVIGAFRRMALPDVEPLVGVIVFGGADARVHLALTYVDELVWTPLEADGGSTPLGDALRLAGCVLDDPDQTPVPSFEPNVILVTDGMPTDAWERGLAELDDSPRGRRARRFAIGIGSDRKDDVLTRFARGTRRGDTDDAVGTDPWGEVLTADQAADVAECFRYVTDALMPVTAPGLAPSGQTLPSADATIADVEV
jgi:uncharacterized protein YegL